MVINNNPCYAYLLKCNNVVDQKLVMAHVYGHCDFFKNNLYFAHTNRNMVDEMANHATRLQRYVERYGIDTVESFIDCCLSTANLIDPHAPFIRRQEDDAGDMVRSAAGASQPTEDAGSCACQGDHGEGSGCQNTGCQSGQGGCQGKCGDGDDPHMIDDEDQVVPRRLKSKGYMDAYINPPDFLKARAEEIKVQRQEKKRFPENPEPDILLFILENAPLKNWQRDVLSLIREEAYYFLPQGQTKIMNEGWATYWHSHIMTKKVLKDGEVIDYADHHSGTLGGSRLNLNPYKLGLELFRDIEERWDKGRFGKEYEDCDDLKVREKWDLKLGLGREKVFEVRNLYNDLTFLDTFLTEDFCRRRKLFIYAKEQNKPQWVIKNREFDEIKATLLDRLTNMGQPLIRVIDSNFENRGELLLAHHHEERDLKWDFASETLVNLHRLWRRPVHVETMKEGKKTRLSFDGKEHQEKSLN
jgi:stage V sporulation protein R